MHVCVPAQLLSCVWLFCDPRNCNLPGSSVHGILQVRKLEWVAIYFSRWSSPPRDQICISCNIKLYCCSVSQLCLTLCDPWTAVCQASLSFTISLSLLKLMSIELVIPSNHLLLCHPFLLPSIFPQIRIFSNESALHIRWPKYWSFCISPSNEYSGLISFRIDWLDLLAAQGTLKSLLQHHSPKASIHQPSAFFVVQLSHPYITKF